MPITAFPYTSVIEVPANTLLGNNTGSAAAAIGLTQAQVLTFLGNPGGAFSADAQTQITPSTAIVLDEATGNEVAIDLSYTVNKATSGNDTGIFLNKTDTASPGTSYLMDLQVGASTKFHIDDIGRFGGNAASAYWLANSTNRMVLQDSTGGNNRFAWYTDGSPEYRMGNATAFGFSSSEPVATSLDTPVYRDAAGQWGFRNATNAQSLSIYSTYTDASNYERLRIYGQTADDFVIASEALGTGTVRGLTVSGVVTLPASNHIITNGGKIRTSGSANVAVEWGTGTYLSLYGSAHDTTNGGGRILRGMAGGGTEIWNFTTVGGLRLLDTGSETNDSQGGLQFCNTAVTAGTTILRGDVADTLSLRNGTNAQNLEIYSTYTDASNYERLRIYAQTGGNYVISQENAGTGSARVLEISLQEGFRVSHASDASWFDIQKDRFLGVGQVTGSQAKLSFASQIESVFSPSAISRVALAATGYNTGQTADIFQVIENYTTDQVFLKVAADGKLSHAPYMNAATGDEVAFDLSYTVNKATSGNDTGIFLNKTDTLSPGTSNLMDLQTGGSSHFRVEDDGTVYMNGYLRNSSDNDNAYRLLSSVHAWYDAFADYVMRLDSQGLNLRDDHNLGWTNTNAGGTPDIRVTRDGIGELALRYGTNTQSLAIYSTYTDASNYERLKIYGQTADAFRIYSEALGTGTQRPIEIWAGPTRWLHITAISNNPLLATSTRKTTGWGFTDGVPAMYGNGTAYTKWSLNGHIEQTRNLEITSGGDLVLGEKADHTSTPAAGDGYVWVRNDSPNALIFTDDTGVDHNLIKKTIGLYISEPGVDLVTGTAQLTFRMPYAMTVTEVRASVATAPTGSTIEVDVNEGGVSIFSTILSIDATEKTSTTAATPAVISDSALADDAEITIDIDQVGSTVPGQELFVQLIGTVA